MLKILHLFLWEKAPLCTHTEKKAAYLCSRLNKSFVFLVVHTYSRVHKSSDSFFSKILEKPSIVQKKMILHIKGLDFSQR